MRAIAQMSDEQHMTAMERIGDTPFPAVVDDTGNVVVIVLRLGDIDTAERIAQLVVPGGN